jgi:SAM-dependent methyltransferase
MANSFAIVGSAILLLGIWVFLVSRAGGEEAIPFLRRKLRLYWKPDLRGTRNYESNLGQLARSIKLPKRTATVTGQSIPTASIRAIVACIQDLHANVSVQRHMSEIIGYLVNVHGFRHVFVEGASGPGDLQLLASLPHLIRKAFMGSLFKKAYLTGSEYAGANRPDWDFELWGVDDPELYRSNWRPAEGVEIVRDQVVQTAAIFRQQIIRVCTKLISGELRDFINVVESRRANKSGIDASEYLRYLVLYANSYSITIPAGLRHLLPELAEDGARWRGASSAAVDLNWTVEPESDFQSLESSIIGAICQASRNPADSPYWLLINTADLAGRAFRLGLQNEEARSFFLFDAERLELRVREAVDKVNGLLEPTDERLEMPPKFGIVFAKWNLPAAFYRTALARSNAMLTNVASQIEKRGIDRAIFVSGGFHSAYVAAQLAHRHGISAVIITPMVDKLDQEPAYRARMLEEFRSKPMGTGTPDSYARLATAVTSIESRIFQLVTGDWRRYVLSKVQDFLLTSPILEGHERILELECVHSDLVSGLSGRLADGIVMGFDQFDYFMAGNEINLVNPQPYIDRLLQTARRENVQILNMNSRLLYFKDETFDWVLSVGLDRIKRVADRKEALREAIRILKPGGILAFLAGKKCDEYGETLVKLGMNEITRIEVLRYIRQSRIIAARKRGTVRLGDRLTLGKDMRHAVIAPAKDGRMVWNRPNARETRGK